MIPAPRRAGATATSSRCGATSHRGGIRRWSFALAAALFALVLSLPHLFALYETSFVQKGVASAVVAATGALGITKASVLLTVRGRLDQWSQLLWNRALAQRVVEATLTLDVVLPPPGRERRIGAAVPERVGRRIRRRAAARPQPAHS
jgi:hypothetical protein